MSDWKETLDAILPEPGIDLGILQDPPALARHARRAMIGARARLAAPQTDLETVLAVLFDEVAS